MKSVRLLVFALTLVAGISGRAAAQDALVLIKDSKVAASEPKLEASQLYDRMIWIGNAKGQTMAAEMLRLDLDGDEVALNPTSGYGAYLGYTKQAQFLAVREQTITAGSLKTFVQDYVAQAGAANEQEIVVVSLAEVDLDGDGRTETLIDAHSERQQDMFEGKPGDVDSLLVIEYIDEAPHVTARFLNIFSGPGRTIPVIQGIARNPTTGQWNLLIQQVRKYWGEGGPKISVTINGQQMAEPDPVQRRVTITETDVYRYADGTLKPIGELKSLEQSFCDQPDCD